MLRILPFILTVVAIRASSQSIDFKDDRSKITFVVENFGLSVNGSFHGLTGTFFLREDSVERSHFEATVRSESIETGVRLRDKHLRQEHYFDIERYPLIRIASRSITKRNGQWLSQVSLTIKNTTKVISMPFTVEKQKSGFIFKSAFAINRLDYDVGDKSFSLADTVNVQLEIFGE